MIERLWWAPGILPESTHHSGTRHGESKESQAERTKMLLEPPRLPPWHGLSPKGVFSTHNLVPEDLLSSRNVQSFLVTVAHKPARSSPK